jgi:hypothetical protein
MGINTHVYTVYGVRLEWNDDFYEAYEEIEEALLEEFGYNKRAPEDRQIEAIIDCMGGEYMIFGPILYDSGDFRWCENMNNYQEIEEVGLFGKWLEYKKEFSKLYPEHVHLLEGKLVKLMNLIHYS